MPLEVSQFGNFEARMLRNFRASVDDWDEVCSALGAWEAQHLASGGSSAAVEHHRVWVGELLSWGQHLQRVTADSGFPDQALNVRINRRLRHIRDKLALWHGDMTPAEEARILEAAFS
jgi:hypothetical protein